MRSLLVTLALLALIGLTTPPPARAAESPFPDIQRILDAGVVRVAILARDVPPMIMTDRDGRPAGAEAELARDLAQKLGVEVDFLRSAETYDGVIDQVATKEADLGISFLSSGVARALRVYFSRPYIRQSGRLFYNRAALARIKRDFEIASLREIPGSAAVSALEIGVLEGSIYQSILEEDFADLRVKYFPSLPELMRAVREDRLFAGVHGGLQIDYFMHRHPSTAIYVAVDPELRRPSDISIAIRPDAPGLLQWVNVYLATNVGLEQGQDIVARYLQDRSLGKH